MLVFGNVFLSDLIVYILLNLCLFWFDLFRLIKFILKVFVNFVVLVVIVFVFKNKIVCFERCLLVIFELYICCCWLLYDSFIFL